MPNSIFLSTFKHDGVRKATTQLCWSGRGLVDSPSAVAVLFGPESRPLTVGAQPNATSSLRAQHQCRSPARHYPARALAVNPAVKHPSYPLPGPIAVTHGLRGSGRHRAGRRRWKRASCLPALLFFFFFCCKVLLCLGRPDAKRATPPLETGHFHVRVRLVGIVG